MKVIFIPVTSTKKVEFSSDNLEQLRNYSKIGLFSAIQFQDQLPEIKEALAVFRITAVTPMPKLHAVREGQVLGCDVSGPKDIEEEVDAFLYIGTGHFHPMALELKTSKPLLCLDPFTDLITETPRAEIELMQKKNIMRIAKEVYIFITELINPYDLSQFPQIEAWVNTACPRITDDQSLYQKPIINVKELLE